MHILYTSDIHTNSNHLNELLSLPVTYNAIIINGDIVPKDLYFGVSTNHILNLQHDYLRHNFIPRIKKFKHKNPSIQIYLDMGNDDFKSGRAILEEYQEELFRLLHMAKYKLTDTLDIVGYMSVPITPFGIKDWEKPDTKSVPYLHNQVVNFKGLFSKGTNLVKGVININSETIEDELAILSKDIVNPFVFVSHAPPYNTNADTLYNHQHVGSQAIRNFIELWSSKNKLFSSFHGHIHEAPDVTGSMKSIINNTVCINIGQTDRVLQYNVFNFNHSGKINNWGKY